MEKTRIWHKDHVSNFQKGDKVVVFRRKNSGHPKCLKDGMVYEVKDVNGDDVIITIEGLGLFRSQQSFKIHKSYLIDIQFVRDELITKILEC